MTVTARPRSVRLFFVALLAAGCGILGGGPAADTTPPTVVMTAPTSGSTVGGTVTVSATATDDVGVAGVQFLLDGAALGAEVAATPYSIPWDTTLSAGGQHALAARARDAAGNQATSASITVTVVTPASGPRFPRLAAVSIGSPHDYDSPTFRDMARKYHVVVVGHWPSWQSSRSMTMAQVMQDVKSRSTVGTRMFIYVNNNEQIDPQSNGAYYPVWQKLNAESWWLYPTGTSGTPVRSSFGGGTQGLCNNTDFGPADATGRNWIRWKADFDYAFNVVGDAADAPNPYVDGFFLDNVFWKPRSDGDWNRDGTTDSQDDPTVQAWLRSGSKSYFDYIRSVWPGSLQLGNADWSDPNAVVGILDQVLDGGMMEGMVGETWSIETWAGFDAMMTGYRRFMDAYRPPKLGIFHHGNWAAGDYQGMRYSLASALMDDAYYDISDTAGYDPDRLLWFDEFDFDLGYPTQPRQAAAWSQGVWRREFDNGIALVNPRGNGPQTVNLGGTFRKLAGTQDPIANDGSTVTSVTLADRDGILLRR